MKGTVKFFNKKKGYGFIYGYGSREVDEKEKAKSDMGRMLDYIDV